MITEFTASWGNNLPHTNLPNTILLMHTEGLSTWCLNVHWLGVNSSAHQCVAH